MEPMDFEVQVLESSFVAPSEPTPTKGLWLSSLDLVQANKGHTPTIYLYTSSSDVAAADFFDVARLKEAMAKALVAFYPLASRLGVNADDGRLEISCNGEGALFVVAQCFDLTVDDVKKLKPSPELRRLFVPRIEPSSIMLAIQPIRRSDGRRGRSRPSLAGSTLPFLGCSVEVAAATSGRVGSAKSDLSGPTAGGADPGHPWPDPPSPSPGSSVAVAMETGGQRRSSCPLAACELMDDGVDPATRLTNPPTPRPDPARAILPAVLRWAVPSWIPVPIIDRFSWSSIEHLVAGVRTVAYLCATWLEC